jgi:hypothetical protein
VKAWNGPDAVGAQLVPVWRSDRAPGVCFHLGPSHSGPPETLGLVLLRVRGSHGPLQSLGVCWQQDCVRALPLLWFSATTH